MAYQTSGNVLVATKRESTTGVAATASGAVQARITDSPGLELKRGIIQSAEKRDDGLKTMGRLGNKAVDGSYNTELTVGGATDQWTEAVMRSTWAAAAVIGFATMTTVAVGSNTLTAAGGDWIGTQGIRVGDVFTISGTATSANNNLRHMVTAVGTLTITFAPGGLTTAAAAATGTITRLKKLVSATTPTRYTHTIEQYDQDIDLSELFLGVRVVGMQVSYKPNSPITVQWQMMGMDRTALTTGTSPWYTSPTLTTGLALIADDAVIRYNGATVTTLTGFDLNFQITAAGQPVIGSLVSPDIFDNDCAVSGTITGVRSDFANLTLFDAETEFEIGILARGTGTAPVDAFGIFLPRVKLQSLGAPVGGGDGAKLETLGLMVGPKVAATGYDGTIAVISSSAA